MIIEKCNQAAEPRIDLNRQREDECIVFRLVQVERLDDLRENVAIITFIVGYRRADLANRIPVDELELE